MTREATKLELNAESPWDGTSDTLLNRDAAIQVPGGRIWQFNVTGPHGVIDATFGGLFSASTAKLIGIAFEAWNPENKARVGAGPNFRQEMTLKPTIQYVLAYPGDKLSIKTVGDPRAVITLVINELNESETMAWAGLHEPFEMPARFRIIRNTGTAFAANPTNTWRPTFAYDPSTNLLVAADDGTGAIPAGDLCLYPRFQGCYVSIRYAGSSGNGRLHIVDSMTRKTWSPAPLNLPDVRWSRVQYVSHDDSIALQATPEVAGQLMVCDIEVSRVFPGDRLAARYANNL